MQNNLQKISYDTIFMTSLTVIKMTSQFFSFSSSPFSKILTAPLLTTQINVFVFLKQIKLMFLFFQNK